MRRTNSIITNKPNIEHLYTIRKFPVYMGCVEDADKDVRRDLVFDICKDTGVIQIRNILSLDLTNPHPHNDSVGNLWQTHNEGFVAFLRQFNLKNIVELGGGSGKLAHEYLKAGENCMWEIYDKNYFGTPHNNIHVHYEWFNEHSNLKKYDAVVHSHVFEHIHDPVTFLTNLRNNVGEDSVHIFSIPNLYEWLKKKYINCLNFEHTIFLTEEIVDTLLKQAGFQIIKKQKHEDHSIFYACKPATPKSVKFKNNYKKYKTLFNQFVTHYEKIVSVLNTKIANQPNVYLFGAHIFSQYLISVGLRTKNIICILDNSALKQNKRLYGTRLYVKSPVILRNETSAVVILLAGAYTKEIKFDITTNINDTVVFVPSQQRGFK